MASACWAVSRSSVALRLFFASWLKRRVKGVFQLKIFSMLCERKILAPLTQAARAHLGRKKRQDRGIIGKPCILPFMGCFEGGGSKACILSFRGSGGVLGRFRGVFLPFCFSCLLPFLFFFLYGSRR